MINLTRAAGVDLTIRRDGSYTINVCVLEKVKNSIIISQQGEGLSSIKELVPLMDAEMPVFLSVQGKGILHKFVPHPEEKENVLKKALHGANIDDFYFQVASLESQYLVSIVRKELLHEILAAFKEQKLYVAETAVNPLALQYILPFLEAGETELYAGKFKLEVADNRIFDIVQLEHDSEIGQERSYKIGEDTVEGKLLPCYATALSFFLPDIDDLEEKRITELSGKEEWEQKKIFKKAAKGVLLSFLILLLINALLFFQFKTTNDELSLMYSKESKSLNRLEALQKGVVQKREFLQNIGWQSQPVLSFYADRLAASLPKDLLLETLHIHPLNEAVSHEVKGQVFSNDLIAVKGKCDNPILLNQWLVEIESLEWVSKVNNQVYNFMDREATGVFSFEIQINQP